MHVDATSLPRLMQCGASKSMPGFRPAVVEQSDDARIGIAAHWLASEYLKGNITDLDEWIDRKSPNSVYMDSDLVDHVRWFVEGVSRDRSTHKKFVEHDMTAHNADRSITIGCRADFLTDDLADYNRRIRIDDFKYGYRIIEPENNWTLIAYALAYIADKRVDADTCIEFRVWQPRPFHPNGPMRVWIIDAAHLSALRDKMFATLAATSNTLVTGQYCVRCPARSNCPAIRKASMSLLDVVEQAIPDDMTMDDMSLMMDALTAADHTLKQYRDSLSERITDAITRGQTVRNYRLQPYEGARDWRPGIDAKTLELLTDKPVSKPAPLLTPTQLKKAFPPNVLESLTYRKPGGVKLRRMDMDQHAQSMFGATTEAANDGS